VIAAAWRVDDEPSVEVMAAPYRRLQVEPPSLALARTQTELRRRPAHHWAGLVFYGQRLRPGAMPIGRRECS